MKKILAFVLALLIISCVFVGCSSEPIETPNGFAIIETTEAPTVFEDIVLVDDENVTIKITSSPYTDDIWGTMIDIYVENKTEKTLMFSIDDSSVNGYMVTSWFATEVTAGKKENTQITFLESEFTENKITTIDTFDFSLNVYDSDDWMADYIIDDLTFSLNFN